MNIKRVLGRIGLFCAVMLPATALAQFNFTTNNGAITITGYTGSGGAVVIPSTINGLPVSSIGVGAFSYLNSLTSVTIPDSVVVINSLAFNYCTSLTNVTFGNSISSIGTSGFQYCSSLINITIPANIQSLGGSAFANCTYLTRVYFQGNAPPDSGTMFYADYYALVYYLPGTTGWGLTYGSVPTALYVPPVPFNYTTNNGAITITAYTGSNSLATVPSTIYVVGASNFLPVTSIGDHAFSGCSNLFTVVISGSVTNLGSYAFSSCSNLVGVFFASNAPSADSTVFSNDNNLLVYCLPGSAGWSSLFAGVPTVQLPYIYTITNGTIAIRSYIGAGGTVNIPGMVGGLPVTRIGINAFAFCGGLTNVTIPDSVTDLGNYTFYACSNLASATLSTNISNIGVSAFDSCSRLTNVNIPDGVFIIGSSAFQNCAGLASIAIPANVASIGHYAFDSCGSLTAITVDPLNTNYSSVDGILVSNTTLIQFPAGRAGNYTVPNSITNIGNFAFDACAGLTIVVISSNVTSIGDWAFSGCSGLTNVMLPNTNIRIGNYAFEACTALKSVTIPDNVTTIGYHAFDGCTSLTDVTIGSGLTSSPSRIGSGNFSDCPDLISIYLQSSAPYFVWNPTNAVELPTAYYLPGLQSPPPQISGLPQALWLPRIQIADGSFGFQINQFGFNISWASGWTVEVDACTDLVQAAWSPVATITITNGFAYFNDSQWTNYPGRFYRLRWP